MMNIGTRDRLQVVKKQVSASLVMVCGYIFLVIERPWESISYLRSIPLERSYGILLIIIPLFAGDLRIVKSPTNKWIFGLLFLHFALAPFAFSSESAFSQSIEYAKLVFIYVLILAVARDEESLKLIIQVFVFSMMLYALHSFIEYLNGRHWYRMGINRMIGVDSTYNDPNGFGESIVLSLPFVIALLFTVKNKLFLFLYASYIPFAVLCVVLTGSRTSFVALIFLIFFLGMIQERVSKFLILVGVLVSIGCIWVNMPEEKQERIATLWDSDAGPANAHASARGRLVGWEVSWEMFKREPLTGVGTGKENFIGYRIANNIDTHLDPDRNASPTQSHVLYGQVLAEMGVAGGMFFLGLVCSIGRSVIVIRRSVCSRGVSKDFVGMLNTAIGTTLLLLLLFGLGGHNFYRPMWMWLAAWLGCLHVIVQD